MQGRLIVIVALLFVVGADTPLPEKVFALTIGTGITQPAATAAFVAKHRIAADAFLDIDAVIGATAIRTLRIRGHADYRL